jgi:lysophospholipase L1-like esterase
VLGILVAVCAGALAGCGGDDAADPSRPPAPQEEAGTVVAALGDSITAGSPRWDPDPALRAQIGPRLDRRSEYGFWAERELPDTAVRNCGVPGERTEEIAGRLGTCARGADVLIVQGGLNDLAQGASPEEIVSNLRAMVRRGRELGLRVAVAELLPWNGGWPRAAGEIRRLNRLIGRIATQEGAAVLPWYRTLEDPARPGRMPEHLTADGAHPSVLGYRRLGESLELP